MLKKPASGVLGSSKSSTYPRGYASGFDSPPALLDGLFEHPIWYSALAVNIHRSASRIDRVQDGT
jgi:hypothetical protein